MLLRKGLILYLLVCYSLIGSAQLSVFEGYLKFNQETNVYPVISSPEIGMPIIFLGGKNIDIVYIDSDHKSRNEISIKRISNNTKQYLGSYLLPDTTLVLTFSNRKMSDFCSIKVNLNSSDHVEDTYSTEGRSQKHLASWEKDNVLFVLGIIENKGEFQISEYRADSWSSREYSVNTIDGNSVYSLLDDEQSELVKLTNNMPVNLYLASSKNKAYLIDDKIVITLDGFSGVTYILELDLLNNRANTSTFKYCENTTRELKTNSYIYQQVLYQIGIDSDSLGLKVQNLNGNGNKAMFSLSNNKPIDFANSTMVRRNEKQGLMYGHPVVRNFRKTQKFLRLVSGMNPAITVFKNKKNIQITLGAVEDTQQAGGVSASMFLASGGPMQVGLGDYLEMPEPIYYLPSNYSFTSYVSRKSVFFSSMVDSTSFNHVSKPITKYTYNFIVDYANLLPGNHSLVSIFKFKGDYYLGYYTEGAHTYHLEWFKNVDDYSIQF